MYGGNIPHLFWGTLGVAATFFGAGLAYGYWGRPRIDRRLKRRRARLAGRVPRNSSGGAGGSPATHAPPEATNAPRR